MNGVLAAALDVDQKLRGSGLPYCLIGGIALQRWGQPRMTLVVDVKGMTDFGFETPVINQLINLFEPRIPDAVKFAEQSRVVLLKTESNIGIDISLGALPYEFRMIARATDWDVGSGQRLTTCSAEDLIVQKAFAGRDQDWVNIANIVIRQSSRLDHKQIAQELTPLLQLSDDTSTMEGLLAMLGNL